MNECCVVAIGGGMLTVVSKSNMGPRTTEIHYGGMLAFLSPPRRPNQERPGAGARTTYIPDIIQDVASLPSMGLLAVEHGEDRARRGSSST